MLVVLNILINYPTRASYNTAVNSSRGYLSSLSSILLIINIKVMASEWILVVINSIVLFVVQTLKSVRIRCTSCSGLSRRVKLGICFTTLSQGSVVLHFVWTITFLTFSTLSTTCMCLISPVLEIATQNAVSQTVVVCHSKLNEQLMRVLPLEPL